MEEGIGAQMMQNLVIIVVGIDTLQGKRPRGGPGRYPPGSKAWGLDCEGATF
jgi:hypothetical protein